jgi:hypothetical protein
MIGIPLAFLTHPHSCAFPKSGPEFPTPYVMVNNEEPILAFIVGELFILNLKK